jgi:hypothetical protein
MGAPTLRCLPPLRLAARAASRGISGPLRGEAIAMRSAGAAQRRPVLGRQGRQSDSQGCSDVQAAI